MEEDAECRACLVEEDRAEEVSVFLRIRITNPKLLANSQAIRTDVDL